MYTLLLIDNDIKKLLNNEIINIFEDNIINYEFVSSPPSKHLQNTLYLTNNRNNIVSNCQSVLLTKKEYDFLNNDSICILNILDIIKIYKQDVIVNWAVELQFLAQNTLTFSKNKFDIERAERLREISCEMLSYKYNTPVDTIKKIFANEVGYKTPKIENRAAIIKDNKILLVREQIDNKWSMPGGYQDVNRTIRENVIKESSEEAGALVKPIKTIALLNYNKHHDYSFPLGMLKVIVLCEYVSHSFEENSETAEAKFFSLDELPELSANRTTIHQINMAFDCYNNIENWEVIFD